MPKAIHSSKRLKTPPSSDSMTPAPNSVLEVGRDEKIVVMAGDEARAKPPSSILAIDVGGTKVKMLVSGQTKPRKADTGRSFTPELLLKTVEALTSDWHYDAVTLGFPGPVGTRGPQTEPGNLGPGWVGFDYAAAFGKPIQLINDAAMQALGGYDGGRMLFLGLGTGLGSALIAKHVIIPLELGALSYNRRSTLGEVLGRRGMKKSGRKAWRSAVNVTIPILMRAFVVDYVTVGGGNAKHLRQLPPGARLGNNLNAFQGGFRLWSTENAWVLAAASGEKPTENPIQILH